MRLLSSSSASPSEWVTVVSTAATWPSINWMRGPRPPGFWKYDATRFLRSRALPTYSTSPAWFSMRYTPGRCGRPATTAAGSNVELIGSSMASAETCGVKMLADGVEDAVEHHRGKPPRLRIVAAAVIAIEQHDATLELVPGAMPERMRRLSRARRGQHGAVRDDAQREYRCTVRKRADFRSQITVAAPHLVRPRMVRGRQALHRIGDTAVTEPPAVPGVLRDRAAGEPMTMQRFVEQDAGMVPGKGAAGAVRAVQAGGQAHDQQPRPRGAERRDRPRVIAGVRLAHAVQVAGQARAEPAGSREWVHCADRSGRESGDGPLTLPCSSGPYPSFRYGRVV